MPYSWISVRHSTKCPTNDYLSNSIITVSMATSSSLTNCNVKISSEEVCSTVSMAHKGKACGDDGIYYEHILYGGEFLYGILSKLFTAIVLLSHVPIEMKKGVIITLFKGGNKRKDDPDSYRAITLSSVILKLLETILLTRIQLFENITQPIHSLQGGF